MSETREVLERRFPSTGAQWASFRGQDRVVAPKGNVFEILRCLRDECGFDMLIDVTGVDYLEYPDATDRFAVVYCLLNTSTGERLVVKTMLNEPDLEIPSAFPLWQSADWLEREVFDMFGIRFADHPNLKRLLLPEEYVSNPLRKDYPVKGRGERHNFPVITRAGS